MFIYEYLTFIVEYKISSIVILIFFLIIIIISLISTFFLEVSSIYVFVPFLNFILILIIIFILLTIIAFGFLNKTCLIDYIVLGFNHISISFIILFSFIFVI